MNSYCSECGSPMQNGVCPICSQGQQQNQQYNYQQVQYQQMSGQNGVCPVCGGQLIDGVCPNCTNQQAKSNGNKFAGKFENFFANPKERLVTTLGNNYIQNFLNNGSIHKGFAVVSDQRAYFKGTSYNIVYTTSGKKKIHKTDRSRTVDLKDVTGTGIDNISNIYILILAIAVAIFGIYTVVIAVSFAPLLIFLPSVVLVYAFYLKSKTSLISIQFAGGEIAFDIKWFDKKEVDDFQKQLRLAKDKAVEAAENAVADKLTQAVSGMGYNSNPTNGNHMSKADELLKYGDLLQKGLISQEEFENVKRGLL